MTLLEEVLTAQDGSHKRRITIQDIIRHIHILCGARAQQGRAPRGNMVRQLSDASPKVEKGRGWGAKGRVPMELSQRLLKEWRDSRQSITERPRRKRESELIASLISATREPKWPSDLLLFCVVDQRDPISRGIHWLVCCPCRLACQLFVFSWLLFSQCTNEGFVGASGY